VLGYLGACAQGVRVHRGHITIAKINSSRCFSQPPPRTPDAKCTVSM